MLVIQAPLIVLYSLLGLLFLVLFVRAILLDIRDSGTIQESRLVFMEPGKKYIIHFKPRFGIKRMFTIEPKKEHQNSYVVNTFYNGRKDVTVKVMTANVVTFSAYMRHVYHITEENIE